jgi:hypothetical protein
MLVLLFEGTCGVCHLDGFMWHDIHTKFYEEWYIYSSNIFRVFLRKSRNSDAGITDEFDL